MPIGTKGVGEGGQQGHVPPPPPTFKSVYAGEMVHKPTWAPPPFFFVTELRYFELTVRQNLYFYHWYRCYFLLFTEFCMNKP